MAAPDAKRPLWLAALLTSVAVPVAYFFLTMIGGPDKPETIIEITRFFSFVMWISLPISDGAMFLLGLPLVLALRACGLLIAGVVWSAAVSIGAVAMLTIYWIDGTGIGLEAFWFGEGCGAFAGLVFVLAAGIPWRRARA